MANRIIEEALSLPSDERADLVEKLLASLNLPLQADIDRRWAEEAERRVEQLERGEVEPITGGAVFAQIRRKHRR